ncbi:unnamed protein product [Microthlaspi erraticum]|uniref:Uncharacterized protein n=1 Tax=Microthlaspi erraticum TaxID=1685480 RepID=A0A6D2IHZ4_9BRAS|nr:unnamed protein product [Microthlaspi erraticum]
MIVMSKGNLYLMSVFVNNGVDLSAEHIEKRSSWLISTNLSIWVIDLDHDYAEAEKVSWSKFTLSSYDEYSILDDIHIRLSFGGFYEEKKVPMFSGQRLNCHLLNLHWRGRIRRDYIERELPAFEDRVWRECVCFYVPSLVQIKQPKGGQSGKKQSDVEKLRYDEMMSRLSYFERRCKRLDLELAKKKASTCKKLISTITRKSSVQLIFVHQ